MTTTHPTVLVIEDDDVDRLGTRRALSRGGIRSVVEAMDVAEGCRAIDGQQLDCVVADYRLPDGDAIDVLHHIETIGKPNLSLVVLTGLEDTRVAQNALRQGAQDYLVKGNYSPELLRKTIDYAMERQRLHSELAVANARLLEASQRDPLTGLNNRRALESILARELERSHRTGSPVCAVMLDLDDFRRINNNFGHAIGDELLSLVGATLTDAIRPTDEVARIGGDEFLLVLPHTNRGAATRVVARCQQALAQMRVPVDNMDVGVTGSFGVVEASELSSLREALQALHPVIRRSKTLGKNHVSVQVQGEADPVVHELRSVRHGIHRVADQALVGCEMLARGRVGELELPGALFQMAYEDRALTWLDLECLKSSRSIAIAGEPTVHVNLFPSTLLAVPTEDIVRELAQFPDPVVLEISEHLFVGSPDLLAQKVRRLKDAGIRVAIDDLGCGRSSLEALVLLQPDVVKIDKALVTNAYEAEHRISRLARLLAMVRAVDAEIVAEGVETEEDRQVLEDLGVELGQGYLWGRPA